MARNLRNSETYRRRLRLSSRDVLVAAVVTALAGVAIVTAVWKPSMQGPQSVGPVETKSSP
jgi:hypothetical protein